VQFDYESNKAITQCYRVDSYYSIICRYVNGKGLMLAQVKKKKKTTTQRKTNDNLFSKLKYIL